MSGKPVLETQVALREIGLQALGKKYGLTIKFHSNHPNLVLLKYRDLNSQFHKRIVQECRGIILDQDDDWNVVAWPYLKFFNYSEKNAAPIDWSTAKVYEKEDGCLATLYWYKGTWHVSSSGVPDASGSLPPYQGTFKDLFWEVWQKLGMKLPTQKNCCYVFELISPSHVIVVRPTTDRLVLHGVRNMDTLAELEPEPIAAENNWEVAKAYPLDSLEAVKKASLTLNPIQNEGYVVRDSHFNRVKVKAPQYVALAHLSESDAGGLNFHNITRILISNEGSEFLVYFPKYTILYNCCKSALNKLKEEITKLSIPIQERLKEDAQQGFSITELRVVEKRLAYISLPIGLQPSFIDLLKSVCFDNVSVEEAFLEMNAKAQYATTELIRQFLTQQEIIECQRYKTSAKKKKKPAEPQQDIAQLIKNAEKATQHVQTLSPAASQKKEIQQKKAQKVFEEEEKEVTPKPKKLSKKERQRKAIEDNEFDLMLAQFQNVPKQESKAERRRRLAGK